MKAYAIIITIAFLIQVVIVTICADKIQKSREKEKEKEILRSDSYEIPVLAVTDVNTEDFMVDGRAEEKVGAELFLKLRERGCVRVYRVHNKRNFITTVTCVVLAKPFNRN